MVALVSEDFLKTAVGLLVRLVESAGALVIFVGAAIAFVRFLDAAVRHRHEPHRFASVRLGPGRYLALGLEFQPARDVLRTAVADVLGTAALLVTVAALLVLVKRLVSAGVRRATAARAAGAR